MTRRPTALVALSWVSSDWPTVSAWPASPWFAAAACSAVDGEIALQALGEAVDLLLLALLAARCA